MILDKNQMLEQFKKLEQSKSRAVLNNYLKNHHVDLYDSIHKMTLFLDQFANTTKNNVISIFERIYCIEHDLTDRPKCKVCSKNHVKFIIHENRYCDWCSISCSQKDPDTKQKLKQTKKAKYGDENFNNNRQAKQTRLKNNNGQYHADDFGEKVKATKFKHFGDENYVNIEKIKQTNSKRFGVEYSLQSDIVREKAKNTKKKLYDDGNFNNRQKFKETLNSFSNDDWAKINKKREKTNFKKYGLKTVLILPENKDKAVQSCLSKFNAENYLNSKKFKQENMLRIAKNSYDNFILNNEHDEPCFSFEEYSARKSDKILLKFKCRKCGNVFEAMHDNGMHRKCPLCYPSSSRFSLISAEFFNMLDAANAVLQKFSFHKTKNKEVCIKYIDNNIEKFFYPDYLFKNKIVEFNGDYWHCNPDKYNNNFINDINHKSAEEIWTYDSKRKNILEKLGYEVFIVWENDFKSNRNQTVNNCLDFLFKNETFLP